MDFNILLIIKKEVCNSLFFWYNFRILTFSPMKDFIGKLPKTTIATILGALLSYGQAKGYIDPDTAVLISTVLVAL